MIQIEAETVHQLISLHQQLRVPCAGLRIVLTGDACQGWRVGLAWSAEARPQEYAVDYQGLVLLAPIAHWPYLQGARIQAGDRDGQRGVWVELQAKACHCDNQVCASTQAISL